MMKGAVSAGFDYHLIKPASPRIIEDLLKGAVDMANKLQRAERAVQDQGAIVGEVRDLIKEVKGDMKELKEDLQQVKEDVKEIKEELRDVKDGKTS